MAKRTRWWFIGGALLLACCCASPIPIIWEIARVEEGTHVERVDWLPEEATDVCYYKTHLWKAFEFDISECGFREWSSYPLKEIPEDDAFALARYTKPNRAIEPDYEAEIRSGTEPSAVISDGLFYEWKKEDMWIKVAYDRRTNRAYFESNSR